MFQNYYNNISRLNNIISSIDKLRNLEQEICKKGYLILSLENCVEQNNKILGDCENEIKVILQQKLREKNEQPGKAIKSLNGCQSTWDIEEKIADEVKENVKLLQQAKEKDLELEQNKNMIQLL